MVISVSKCTYSRNGGRSKEALNDDLANPVEDEASMMEIESYCHISRTSTKILTTGKIHPTKVKQSGNDARRSQIQVREVVATTMEAGFCKKKKKVEVSEKAVG
jgi:hypothetical protein